MTSKESPIEQYHLHKQQPERLQFETFSMQEYLEKYQEHTIKPHSHSYYQIIWFFKAGGQHHVDFNAYPIEANTIFFVAKDQIHYFDDFKNYEGLLIHFNERFLMQSDVDIFLKYKVFNNQGKPYSCITEETEALAKAYVGLIETELAQKGEFGHRQVVRYLLKALLILLERKHLENQDADIESASNYDKVYLHFRDLLETHYKEGLTVSQYAEKLNISSKTLTTVVKSVATKAPSAVISERLLLEAQRLLSFTNHQVNEIGYQLGFEDPSYFVKYFKRMTGQSPGDYRKAYHG